MITKHLNKMAALNVSLTSLSLSSSLLYFLKHVYNLGNVFQLQLLYTNTAIKTNNGLERKS